MASVHLLFVSLYILIGKIHCHGSVMSLVQKLNNLDSRVLQHEMDHQRLREEMYGELDVMEMSLREELINSIVPNYLEKKVKNVIQRYLRVNSLDDLLNSRILSEIRHMRTMLRTLKTQTGFLSRKLSECEARHTLDQESSWKKNFELEQRISFLEQYSERQGLKRKTQLELENSHEDSLIHRNQSFEINNKDQSMLNCSCLVRMSDLEYHSMDVRLDSVEHEGKKLNATIKRLESSFATIRDSWNNETRACLGGETISHLQMRMQEARSRIILCPFQSSENDWKEFFIHKNMIKEFVSTNITFINAIAIDTSRSVLFIASFNPLGIFRSELHKPEVTLLRENVRSYGIDVDSERQVVIFTMHTPKYAICRMNTDGSSFTFIIDLSSYGSTPWAVALDVINERIYATTTDKLLSVTYDGTDFKTLFSGRSMYSLTLDYVNKDLYFNDGDDVRKVSINSTASVRVSRLPYTPRMLVFYSNTLYIGGGKSLDALYFYRDKIVQVHLISFYKTYIGTFV